MAEEIKMLDLDSAPLPSTTAKPVDKISFSFPIVPVVAALVVIVAGVLTGYLLVPKGSDQNGGELSSAGISSGSGKEAGIVKIDESKYDTATGEVQAGGIDGEGTHKLIRSGGPSQTAYLTSSAVDLDQFVNKKVQLWGKTMGAKKAGWLIDVVKVKVVE